jgi:hypothetical protein
VKGGLVPQVKQVLEYARTQADELAKDMTMQPGGQGYGPYWKAHDQAAEARIAARAVAALEFFRQYAGVDSVWAQRAVTTYEENRHSSETGARALGDLLRAWADQVDAGIVEIAGSRAWTEVGIVSTDVMGQVRRLLEDRAVHPAAPIVLCGAALEIALRAVADARNVPLPAKPTMNTLTGALRGAGLLTVQDVKDLEAVAGVRNQAAHGQFGDLSGERAGLMEQQTNILLRRLADLMQ